MSFPSGPGGVAQASLPCEQTLVTAGDARRTLFGRSAATAFAGVRCAARAQRGLPGRGRALTSVELSVAGRLTRRNAASFVDVRRLLSEIFGRRRTWCGSARSKAEGASTTPVVIRQPYETGSAPARTTSTGGGPFESELPSTAGVRPSRTTVRVWACYSASDIVHFARGPNASQLVLFAGVLPRLRLTGGDRRMVRSSRFCWSDGGAGRLRQLGRYRHRRLARSRRLASAGDVRSHDGRGSLRKRDHDRQPVPASQRWVVRRLRALAQLDPAATRNLGRRRLRSSNRDWHT